jgi:hypothetical protein
MKDSLQGFSQKWLEFQSDHFQNIRANIKIIELFLGRKNQEGFKAKK